MSECQFTISLRIRHPRIEPAQITQALGIEPQYAWQAGEPRRDIESDERTEGAYHESYWTARLVEQSSLSADAASIESVLLQILARLRRSFEFLRDLNEEEAVTELHISVFASENFRLELLPESLILLGRLGLALSLEVNPPAVAPPASLTN